MSPRGNRLLPVLVGLVMLVATGCRTNPVTGRPEIMLVSASEEIALGHQTHPNVIFMYDGEYRDPDLNRYLGTIVKRLHQVSHRTEMPTEFTMVNTSEINAFAIPGHVYATRGFLAKLQNEAQFASVMGHELAHVTAGHSAKQMTRDTLTGLALGLGDLVAGDTLAGSVAMTAGQLGAALTGLSYSREQERQADRVGAYYMALAGWDARQAPAMQRLLKALSEREDGVLDRFLSTHPLTDNRIGEIEDVIDDMDLASPRYIQGDGVYEGRWKRHLRRLRNVDRAFGPYDRGTKQLADKGYPLALTSADEAIAIRDDQAPLYRLRGDALRELGKLNESAAAYKKALKLDPRYVPANVGLGRVYYRAAEFADAETQFTKAAYGHPNSLFAWYGLGMSRYGLKHYRDAVDPLALVAPTMEADPQVHYALAVCYDNTGRGTKARESYRQALSAGLTGEDRDNARRRVSALGG